MRKYVLTLAVLAAVPLSSLAMAADADQTDAVVAAGAIQLSDEEMDNVSAAGLALGQNGQTPGQLMKNQLSLQVLTECDRGRSCYAPGRFKGASAFSAGINRGNSSNAPGHNK